MSITWPRPEDVAAYCPTHQDWPWLWKAQRTLASAEMLREKGRFDCAANRYYFATVQVEFHFLGDVPRPEDIQKYGIEVKPRRTPQWPKGILARAYRERFDNEAQGALGRAFEARRRADYQRPPVEEGIIRQLVGPVCGLVVRAMDSAGVPRRTDD